MEFINNRATGEHWLHLHGAPSGVFSIEAVCSSSGGLVPHRGGHSQETHNGNLAKNQFETFSFQNGILKMLSFILNVAQERSVGRNTQRLTQSDTEDSSPHRKRPWEKCVWSCLHSLSSQQVTTCPEGTT